MRQLTHRSLWIGNAGDLRQPRMILDSGIEAVIELADNELFAELPRDLIRCRFPLSDGGDNPLWLIRLVGHTICQLLKANVAVLVACSAGMSRSLCAAAAGMALVENRSLSDCVKEVAGDGPADVSPVLYQQFQMMIDREKC